MLQCWSKETSDRPNFSEICQFFDALLQADIMSRDTTKDQDYVNLLLSVDLKHELHSEEDNAHAPTVAHLL